MFKPMKKSFTDTNEALLYFNSMSPDSSHYGEGQFNAGVIYQSNGNILKAIECYENGIKCSYVKPEIFYNLAICYNKKGEENKAIKCYIKAISINPNFYDAKNNLYNILLKIGNELTEINKIDEAISFFLKNLSIAPDCKYLEALMVLARSYARKGDIYRSKRCIIKAVELFPISPVPYLELSIVKKFNPNDSNLINHIKYLYKNYSTDENDEEMFCWALGKIYNDIGRYNQAFEYYKKANSLFSKHIDSSLDKNIEFKDKMIKIFNKEFVSRIKRNGTGNKSRLPVFVAGHNRTGTSLIATKLSMIEGIYSAGEVNYFNKFEKGYPDHVPYETRESIYKLSLEYLTILRKFSDDDSIIIDKMPYNLKHIGWILTLFPDAKIILCKRHPLDICLSNWFLKYELNIGRDSNQFSYDLITMAKYYKIVDCLIKHWLKLFKKNIFILHYENLILNTEKIGKKLVSFLDMKWNSGFLNHQYSSTITNTSSLWQVKQKLYKSSIYRWKNYEKNISELISFLKKEIIEYELELESYILNIS